MTHNKKKMSKTSLTKHSRSETPTPLKSMRKARDVEARMQPAPTHHHTTTRVSHTTYDLAAVETGKSRTKQDPANNLAFISYGVQILVYTQRLAFHAPAGYVAGQRTTNETTRK